MFVAKPNAASCCVSGHTPKASLRVRRVQKAVVDTYNCFIFAGGLASCAVLRGTRGRFSCIRVRTKVAHDCCCCCTRNFDYSCKKINHIMVRNGYDRIQQISSAVVCMTYFMGRRRLQTKQPSVLLVFVNHAVGKLRQIPHPVDKFVQGEDRIHTRE